MFVVGTAGHIDHGKSSLVLKMTGIDPDRLPEEKERGMTIDLGFAWAELPSGRSIGIVDVPGHERFVKNMVAGVGGIDAVIFVIAADDGWMPQSDEHFNIISLLGIKTGLVALTKCDLVDDDLIQLHTEDIRARLQGSFLENCQIIPASTIDGRGIDEIKSTLDNILTNDIQKPDIGAARLFIDRRFIMQGMGTVVTGTLLEGKLAVDQQVDILPSGLKARIRSLQTHKKSIKEASPGSRVAINLAGIDKDEIERGEAICLPGTVSPASRIGVELTLLNRSKFPLRNGSEVSFLLGTADIQARVFLLDDEIIKPGQKSILKLVLKSPVPAKIGDRFIIRMISPQDTIGGGIVLDTDVVGGRKNRSAQSNILKSRLAMTPDAIIKSELAKSSIFAKSVLFQNTPFEKKCVDDALKLSSSNGEIIISGDKIIQASFLEKYALPGLQIIESEHKAKPWSDGVEPGFLAKRLKLDIESLSPVIEYLISEKKIMNEKGLLRLAEHKAELKPEQKALQGKLNARLSASPLSAPIRKEFVDEDASYEVVINYLRDKGEIIELKGGILFTKRDFETITNNLSEYLESAGKATVSDIKSFLKTSRKYVIPLLERFDQMGLTLRDGDYRILRDKRG